MISMVVFITDNRFLCLDLGHKTVVTESPLPNCVTSMNEVDTVVTAHSEERLVVRVDNIFSNRVGDVWYGIPFLFCLIVALHKTRDVLANGCRTKS